MINNMNQPLLNYSLTRGKELEFNKDKDSINLDSKLIIKKWLIISNIDYMFGSIKTLNKTYINTRSIPWKVEQKGKIEDCIG